MRYPPRQIRTAFTLLEILLSLALIALILIALTMGIDFHLRVAEKGRRHVEESQLARALLQRMATDLRSTVRYNPVDVASLVPITSTETDLSDEIDETDETSDMEEFDSYASDESIDEMTSPESAYPRTVPGLYGESDWLQTDVARLPRLDQFDASLYQATGSTLIDRVSDVKTIVYYVAESDAVGSGGANTSSGGLVRRELDRAVTSWAAEEGTLDEMDRDLSPLAPEVERIAFRYFDGTEWVESWNSDEMGGLPMAVEMVLAFVVESHEDDTPRVEYRLVVGIPSAEPTADDEAIEEGTEGEGEVSEETNEEMSGAESDE